MKREFSVNAAIKEQANTSRGFYRLAGNFFRFWYTFVFTSYSDLEASDTDGVYEYVVKPLLHEFASLAFEDICWQYV